jgi:L-threonylcarbamoyladenylate synthase
LVKRLKNSSNTADIRPIDPIDPEAETIRRAADVLARKGLLVFPTTGLYGLGADALCVEAIERVFAVKRRPSHMPLLVMIAALDDMDGLVASIPEYAHPLMGLWPGGITLIFDAGERVPTSLTGGMGKIGVRLPLHPVARALTRAFGGPITATSANLSGLPAPSRTMDLDDRISTRVDMVLDAGSLAGGVGSTIVDLTCWPVRVVREGAVSRDAIDRALESG